MPILKVNHADCTCCGECAATCPVRIIRLPEGSFPRFCDDGAERCIICGHCEAVCPTAAIAVDDPRLDPTTYPALHAPIPKEQLAHHLRMRRSIRRFKPEPVERETLQELLDLMRYAPTGMNCQELQWMVIYDTAELRRLSGLVVDWMRHLVRQNAPAGLKVNFEGMIKSWEKGNDPISRKAPRLVLPHAHKDFPLGTVDGLIALSYLDLAAPAYGIGTCWAGYFQYARESWQPLRDALGLPEGHQPAYAMLLGKPAVSYQRPPKRNFGNVVWR
ncbi:MAG: nitroreductase family protein [Trichlorobacter sp.]|uniref:nitroreductase family protein n=1 Tax=Trichlorobacter sp. TaxID=2911007 RepID=UPI00256E25CF|nr:nitroreductase family protein [Trichlorobacter sp.]MDK9716807.1 nitroreductase family protein [Trichlorobacter sp.]